MVRCRKIADGIFVGIYHFSINIFKKKLKDILQKMWSLFFFFFLLLSVD